MDVLNIVSEILSNNILITSLSAMVLAQASKIVLYLFTDKKLSFKPFFEVGGMPSSHSAMVSCLVMMVGLTQGFDSIQFSISVVLASIVMYDAIKVRPEIVGHSMAEVITGSIFGLIIGVISFNLFH